MRNWDQVIRRKGYGIYKRTRGCNGTNKRLGGGFERIEKEYSLNLTQSKNKNSTFASPPGRKQ
jgi:hypothetical protein